MSLKVKGYPTAMQLLSWIRELETTSYDVGMLLKYMHELRALANLADELVSDNITPDIEFEKD